MVVRMGDRDLGAIGLMDTPREAARTAIAKLRELGIGRMIMISGDHQKVAESIAAEVGIDEAWGDLMPDQKVDAIRSEEHTSELQSLMRISYADFCLKKKYNHSNKQTSHNTNTVNAATTH